MTRVHRRIAIDSAWVFISALVLISGCADRPDSLAIAFLEETPPSFSSRCYWCGASDFAKLPDATEVSLVPISGQIEKSVDNQSH